MLDSLIGICHAHCNKKHITGGHTLSPPLITAEGECLLESGQSGFTDRIQFPSLEFIFWNLIKPNYLVSTMLKRPHDTWHFRCESHLSSALKSSPPRHQTEESSHIRPCRLLHLSTKWDHMELIHHLPLKYGQDIY
jgi:hypothetical protein